MRKDAPTWKRRRSEWGLTLVELIVTVRACIYGCAPGGRMASGTPTDDLHGDDQTGNGDACEQQRGPHCRSYRIARFVLQCAALHHSPRHNRGLIAPEVSMPHRGS